MPALATPLPTDIRLMNAAANLLFVIAALVLVVVALAWLARWPVFTLRGVLLEGELARSSVASIRANAMPRLAGNFFSVDLDAARRAFETVPWVRQAVVRRVWPNRVAVALEEHRAMALWLDEDGNGNDRIVNSHGEIFEANVGDVEDDGLPRFAGPESEAPRMLDMWHRLSEQFVPLQAAVAELSLTRRGSWRAELDTGAVIELGRGRDDEVVARTGRFVRTLAQVDARFERPLEYADLRHADGYAVRLKGITTTMPESGSRKK